MATTIAIPKEAVTEFDMPRVCVATGATEGVEYRRVKFSFVPMWRRTCASARVANFAACFRGGSERPCCGGTDGPLLYVLRIQRSLAWPPRR